MKRVRGKEAGRQAGKEGKREAGGGDQTDGRDGGIKT